MLQPQADVQEVDFLDTPISMRGTRTWSRLSDQANLEILKLLARDVLPDNLRSINKTERSHLLEFALDVFNQPLPKDLVPHTYRALAQWSVDRYNFLGQRIHSCWSHGTRLLDRTALLVNGSINWTTCVGPFLVYKGHPMFCTAFGPP